MKKSKFTEEHICFALKQAETGVRVGEVCRKMGISDATFYNWEKRYGGLGTVELRRLRQLDELLSNLGKQSIKGRVPKSPIHFHTGQNFTNGDQNGKKQSRQSPPLDRTWPILACSFGKLSVSENSPEPLCG